MKSQNIECKKHSGEQTITQKRTFMADMVYQVLEIMKTSKSVTPTGVVNDRFEVKQKETKGIPLFVFDKCEPFLATEFTHSPYELIRPDAWIADLKKQLDVKIVAWNEEENCIQFTRVKMPKFSEMRGKVIAMLPSTIEVTGGFVRQDRVLTGQHYFARRHDGIWLDMSVNAASTKQNDITDRYIGIMCGIQLAKESQWRVYLSFEDGPGVELPTDPIGVSELFKFRDTLPGETRRKAIRHWVTEHWRQNRKDLQLENKVRAYLRGNTIFKWNGLQCIVKPSFYDELLDNALKEERIEQKAQGVDEKIVHDTIPDWYRSSWLETLKKFVLRPFTEK
jgi:hypothetical protein